jgi:hypothetical protein
VQYAKPDTSKDASEAAPLDELMLAMDVVDTLRHRELMLTREVEADDREEQLVARLREIYAAQGITVSDDVLSKGVEALREERFAYQAPAAGWSRSLALLYVTRARWGKWAGGTIAAAVLAGLAIQLFIVGPRARAAAELPASLESTYQTIVAETQDSAALADAERLLGEGQAAVAGRDYGAARGSLGALHTLDSRLREQYDLRIVSRPGERSGVWRVPSDNSRARNYYLIVEAVAPNGARLKLPIKSEEDGRTKVVDEWGLRVDEATYGKVAADKRDDGIIEQNVVGAKRRGALTPDYTVATTGAAITKW